MPTTLDQLATENRLLQNFQQRTAPPVEPVLPTPAPVPEKPVIDPAIANVPYASATPSETEPQTNITYLPPEPEPPAPEPDVVPYTPTLAEIREYNSKNGIVEPVLDLTAEELAELEEKNPKDFNLEQEFVKLQPYWNQELFDKASKAYNLLERKGGKINLGLGELLPTAGHAAVGAVSWAQKAAKAWGVPFAIAAEKIDEMLGLPPSPAAIASRQKLMREAGEAASGTEASVTSLAFMGEKAINKLFGKKPELKTPQEQKDSFKAALVPHLAQEQISKGAGLFSFRPEVREELKQAGVPIRPEEVEKAAAGDPIGFLAFGKGLEGVGALTGLAKPVARLATKIPGVPTAIEAAQKVASAAKEIPGVTPLINAAKATTPETVAGKTLTGAGRAVEAGAKLVEKVAPIGVPVATAIAGGSVLSALGHVAGGIGGGLAAGALAAKPIVQIAGLVKRLGAGAATVGREIAGKEAVTGSLTQATKDVLQSLPSAAVATAHGAALDLGLAALTNTTPGDQGGLQLGTILGALQGLRKTGAWVVSGQRIAPRAWGSANPIPSSGQFPAFDALHRQTYSNATPAQRQHINAVQEFLRGVGANTDVFLGDAEGIKQALIDSGITPENAEAYSKQEGMFLQDLPGRDGTNRRVIVLKDADAAPHEAQHAFQDVLGEQANQVIDKVIRENYADEWDSMGQHYAELVLGRKLAGNENWRDTILDSTGSGNAAALLKLQIEAANKISAATGAQAQPGDVAAMVPERLNAGDWKNILTPAEQAAAADKYISREVAAENFDAIFKNLGQSLKERSGILPWLARVVASTTELLGGDSLAGRRTDLGFKLNEPTIEALKGQAREFTPEVTPKQPTGSTRPAIVPRSTPSAPPGTPEQEAEITREIAATDAPTTPTGPEVDAQSQQEILGTFAEAKARNSGVKITRRSAPGTPAGAIEISRGNRREQIETARGIPDSEKPLWEKNFVPVKTVVLKDGSLQEQGWSPEVLAANGEKVANFLSDTDPSRSPYGIDPATKSFTADGWRELFNDFQTYAGNQAAGLTGRGTPIKVGEAAKLGFYEPAGNKQAVGSLSDEKMNFINYLMGFPLPGKGPALTRGGKAQLGVQLISQATEPGRAQPLVEPRTFESKQAQQLGFAGEQMLEVNPFRAEIEAMAKSSGVAAPSPIEVWQNLNVKDIVKSEVAPELPAARPVGVTVRAGFKPKAEGEQEHPFDIYERGFFAAVDQKNFGLAKQFLERAAELSEFQRTLERKGDVSEFGNPEIDKSFNERQARLNEMLSELPGARKGINEFVEPDLAGKVFDAGGKLTEVPPQHSMEGTGFKSHRDLMEALMENPGDFKKVLGEYPFQFARLSKIYGKSSEPRRIEFRLAAELADSPDASKALDELAKNFAEEGGGDVNGKYIQSRQFWFNKIAEIESIKNSLRISNGYFGKRAPFSQVRRPKANPKVTFKPSTNPKAVREAAIKDEKTGKIYTGATHGYADEKIPALDKAGPNKSGPFVDGFVTNDGEFLTREGAYQRALKLQQITPESYAQGLEDAWGDKVKPVKRAAMESVGFGAAKQFKPSTNPKAIKEAAVRDDKGDIYTAPIHAMATMKALEARGDLDLSSFDPFSVMDGWTDGFVTNAAKIENNKLVEGEFLDRAQAHQRAVELKQVSAKSETAQTRDSLESGLFAAERRFKPSTTNKEVKDVAEKYAGRTLPSHLITKVNEDLAKRIADYYQTAKNEPENPEVKASYDALAKETRDQYQAIVDAGYTLEPWTGKGEPYKSSAEMVNDVTNNKHLYFLRTGEAYGGGTEGEKNNLMLQPSGVKDWPVNDLFRVVHDFFGHAKEGNGFGPQGELTAWREHSEMYSPEAQGALAAETLGQNSWVNYGEHLRNESGSVPKKGEQGYKPLTERPFAEQKNFVMPQEFIDAAKKPEGAVSVKFSSPTFDAEINKIKTGDSFGQTFTSDGNVWKQTKPSDVVTMASVNIPKENLSPEAVRSSLEKYGEVLDKPGIVAGVFELDPKTVSADVNVVVPQEYRDNTFKFASDNDQHSFFDADKNTIVETGGKGNTVLKTVPEILDAAEKLVKGEPVQFKPKAKKKQDDLKLLGTQFGEASKAWILPNGKVEQLGAQWHHAWLDEHPDIQKKYGLDIPPFEGGDSEGVREQAIKKGFARVNLDGATLVVEAREKDWKHVRPIIEDMIDRNIDDIDKFRVNLLNDKVDRVTKSYSDKLFDADTDKEKMDRVYESFADLPKTGEVRFSPSKEERTKSGVGPRIVKGEPMDYEEARPLLDERQKVRNSAVQIETRIGDLLARVKKPRDIAAVEKAYNIPKMRDELAELHRQESELDDKLAPFEHFDDIKYGNAAESARQAMENPPGPKEFKLPGIVTIEDFSENLNRFDSNNPTVDSPAWVLPDGSGVEVPVGAMYHNDAVAGFREFGNAVDEAQNRGAMRVATFDSARHLGDYGGGQLGISVTQKPTGAQIAHVQKMLDEKTYDGEPMYDRIAIDIQDANGEVIRGKNFNTFDKGKAIRFLRNLGEEKPPAQFKPSVKAEKGEQEQLFGGREYVSPANLTQAELRERYPEAIVPRNSKEKIASDIVGSPLYKKSENPVQAFADKLVEFANKHKDNPVYQLGLKWYSDFAPLLKKEFGKDAPMMAELLAASSPNETPTQNFYYAVDALEGFKSGRFDKIVEKFNQGFDMYKDDKWLAWYNKELNAGNIPNPPQNPTPEAFLAHWIYKHNLKPRQSNGQLFGFHGRAILEVFARKWLEQNQGPKVANFVQNLQGSGHEATIDVWADRTMRRVGYEGFKDRWRIMPANGEGVSDADFAFAQKAFRAAAEKLGIEPDALQGGLWFAEKQLWADNGWGRLDLGSYVNEMEKLPLIRQAIKQRLSTTEKRASVKPAEAMEFELTPRNLKK